jgi:hypothetical protein
MFSPQYSRTPFLQLAVYPRVKSTLCPDSVDTPPFDNSAFGVLVESSRTAPDVCHEATVYLETISEEPETHSPNHLNPVGHPESLSGWDEGGHMNITSEGFGVTSIRGMKIITLLII